MTTIKNAVYQGDACGKQVTGTIYGMVFKAKWDSSIHTPCVSFDVCGSCYDKCRSRDTILQWFRKRFLK